MQQNILDANPETEISVYAVWFNMLITDHRSRWDESLLEDPRVIHLWDQDREVGSWFAAQGFYPYGRVAWDIYFFYGPEAAWDEVPGPLLSSGFTIIANRQQLAEAISPLLEEP